MIGTLSRRTNYSATLRSRDASQQEMVRNYRGRDIRTKFKVFYGTQVNLNDLMLWHKFEENNPGSFIEMYQFWCQKL